VRNDPVAHERARVEHEQARAERVEGRSQGGGLGIHVALNEERLERPRTLPDLAHQMEEQCDVPSAGEAVNESVEERGVAGGVERGDESARARAEPPEKILKASANRGDATVGEARSDQPDDLPIFRIVIPTNDSDGVAVEEAPVVPATQILKGQEEG